MTVCARKYVPLVRTTTFEIDVVGAGRGCRGNVHYVVVQRNELYHVTRETRAVLGGE